MREIRAIGVYCSSYDTVNSIYKKAAVTLGKELAKRKITLIYGGGNKGLMGEVANTAMKHGGYVIGYMPDHLKEFEEPNWGITEMHMVDSMHTRKRLMFEKGDGFFILPGGFGTLDEAFELITWHQLELHDKPIIFINIKNYWTPLKILTKKIIKQHFAKPEHKKCFHFVDTVPEAFQVLTRGPEPVVHEPMGDWV
ncbi:MAG: hypothetical protein ACD_16C00100G0058 [uncultured bacterium]|nr:MAG: hypothetical protein ACD_16C00100G0058 [uncultured bacterium]OFW68075.1 MAG: Rossman fold protein, TIGR00730 family [Alphaproteobacteria bacterium GWC2_42_16]OFW73465.1 MAG: Rossman fold protein, TIGR00730 family [Alphaproteobacteria bacterium GWA2_41_27]OFW82315.1 MAG: Rossman fold protein, TIGR00730 family [Alphaproteobacteria bacterium RIFCSPHIGHO2_12_FULL_42_100]OFW86141.1 MAG: Rossman fold protein, TIGR00730 family [Alphaproteobacteria bacterium RBG_16_42_14]OFW91701.1 MAG: Rossma